MCAALMRPRRSVHHKLELLNVVEAFVALPVKKLVAAGVKLAQEANEHVRQDGEACYRQREWDPRHALHRDRHAADVVVARARRAGGSYVAAALLALAQPRPRVEIPYHHSHAIEFGCKPQEA